MTKRVTDFVDHLCLVCPTYYRDYRYLCDKW